MKICSLFEAHHESMVDTLCELFEYYHDAAADRPATRRHLLDNILGPQSALELLVAVDPGQEVAGFAAISFVYSLVEPDHAHNRQCTMKELYVRLRFRGQNIGRLLMTSVAQRAAANQCSRIDWHVKASNDRGISFYESLGARCVGDRLNYRISGDGLHTLTALPTQHQ